MAVYEPIRDSFREFNRMLLDAQQWDVQHKENQFNREMEQAKLMNGLEQQAFNNRMTAKEFGLRVQGENRLADKLAQDTLHQNRMFQHTQTEFAEDQLNNKSKRQLNEAQRKQVELTNDQLIEENAARPRNVLSVLDETTLGDPVAIDELNDIMSMHGVRVMGNGMITDLETNQVLPLSGTRFGSILPSLIGFAEKYENPIERLEANEQRFMEEADLIDQDIKTMSTGDSRMNPQLAQLRAERNRLRGQAAQARAQIEGTDLIKMWRSKSDRLKQQAMVASANKQDKLAIRLQEYSRDLDARIKNALDRENQQEIARSKGKTGKVPDLKKSISLVADRINPSRASLSGFPRANNAISYGNEMVAMLKDEMPQGPQERPDEYEVRIADEAYEMVRAQHSQLRDEANKIRNLLQLDPDADINKINPNDVLKGLLKTDDFKVQQSDGDWVTLNEKQKRELVQMLREMKAVASETIGWVPDRPFNEDIFFTGVGEIGDGRQK